MARYTFFSMGTTLINFLEKGIVRGSWVISVAVLLAAVLGAPAVAGDEDWETYFEKSGGKATPRHAETVEYCKRLDKASRWIRYTTFGVSPQGRDLPLLIASSEKVFSPEAAARARRDGHVVLLIEACIHAGESGGKDAGLMLLRDIAVTKKYPDLLDNVTGLQAHLIGV